MEEFEYVTLLDFFGRFIQFNPYLAHSQMNEVVMVTNHNKASAVVHVVLKCIVEGALGLEMVNILHHPESCGTFLCNNFSIPFCR